MTSQKSNIYFYAIPDILNLNQFESFKNKKNNIFQWIKNVTYSYDNHNIHGLDASHSIILYLISIRIMIIKDVKYSFVMDLMQCLSCSVVMKKKLWQTFLLSAQDHQSTTWAMSTNLMFWVTFWHFPLRKIDVTWPLMAPEFRVEKIGYRWNEGDIKM